MQTVFLALNVEYEGYKQEEQIFKGLESPYYVDQSQNNIHQHETSYIRSDISYNRFSSRDSRVSKMLLISTLLYPS